jgi:hypothetical protein
MIVYRVITNPLYRLVLGTPVFDGLGSLNRATFWTLGGLGPRVALPFSLSFGISVAWA